jgi:O-antigen/teichoic acid export membrane protein
VGLGSELVETEGEHTLVRAWGTWESRRAARADDIRMIVRTPGGEETFLALPTPGAPPGGPRARQWSAGFAIPTRLTVADDATFALVTGGDRIFQLPRPVEQAATPRAGAATEGRAQQSSGSLGGLSLAGGAGTLAIGALISRLAYIVSISVLARVLTKTEMGTVQQLGLLLTLSTPLLLGGVPASLLYFLPRAASAEQRRVWLFHAYAVLTAFGLAAATATILLRQPLAEVMNSPGLESALVAYAPFVAFSFLLTATPNALVATGQAPTAALFQAIGGILTLVPTVGAALISPDATSVALGMSAGAALQTILGVALVRRAIGLSPADATWRLPYARELVSYGLPLALTGLAATLGFQFDRLIVTLHFGAADYAVYALGAIEIPLVVILQQSINSVLLPELSRRYAEGDVQGLTTLWREAARKTGLIMLPMFAFLMAAAEDVIRILYGPGFEGSVEFFRIYLFLIPLRLATYGLITQAIGRTKVNLAASIVMLASNAAIALTLIGPVGLVGAAVAGPASSLIVATFYLTRLRRILAVRISNLLPWGSIAGTAAVSAAATLPVIALNEFGIPPVLRLILGTLAFGSAAVLAMRAVGILNDEDWSRLRGTTVRLRRVLRRGAQ